MELWETQEPYYQVVVEYEDTTDILEGFHYRLEDALTVRDSVIEQQRTERWDGLRYVYVMVNERRMA